MLRTSRFPAIHHRFPTTTSTSTNIPVSQHVCDAAPKLSRLFTHCVGPERPRQKRLRERRLSGVHRHVDQLHDRRRHPLLVRTTKVQPILTVGSERVEHVEPPEGISDSFHVLIRELFGWRERGCSKGNDGCTTRQGHCVRLDDDLLLVGHAQSKRQPEAVLWQSLQPSANQSIARDKALGTERPFQPGSPAASPIITTIIRRNWHVLTPNTATSNGAHQVRDPVEVLAIYESAEQKHHSVNGITGVSPVPLEEALLSMVGGGGGATCGEQRHETNGDVCDACFGSLNHNMCGSPTARNYHPGHGIGRV